MRGDGAGAGDPGMTTQPSLAKQIEAVRRYAIWIDRHRVTGAGGHAWQQELALFRAVLETLEAAQALERADR